MEPEQDAQAPSVEGHGLEVRARLTRRPRSRARRFALVTRTRVKNLAAPLEAPGAELAELPGIGVLVIIVLAVIALFVVGILLGGFLVALVELIILGCLGLAGSIWAWLRGHPKVAVIEIGEHRWQRHEPLVDILEDERSIRKGADPSTLGYHQIQ